MAINLPIVTQFSDKGIKAAKAAFANFKTDVGNATARKLYDSFVLADGHIRYRLTL